MFPLNVVKQCCVVAFTVAAQAWCSAAFAQNCENVLKYARTVVNISDNRKQFEDFSSQSCNKFKGGADVPVGDLFMPASVSNDMCEAHQKKKYEERHYQYYTSYVHGHAFSAYTTCVMATGSSGRVVPGVHVWYERPSPDIVNFMIRAIPPFNCKHTSKYTFECDNKFRLHVWASYPKSTKIKCNFDYHNTNTSTIQLPVGKIDGYTFTGLKCTDVDGPFAITFYEEPDIIGPTPKLIYVP